VTHENANSHLRGSSAAEDDTFGLPEGVTPAAAPFDPRALTAAMMSADTDVDMPARGHAGSVISNLISLAPGECFTKSVVMGSALSADGEALGTNELKHRLRQSLNQSIRHAKKYDGRELSMESSVAALPSGRVIVFVLVTRTS